LTTDYEFIRVLENNISKVIRNIFSPVRIMTPSALGEELRVIAIPHYILTPLDCDWFYEMILPQIIEKRRS
jgi:hypothetical protein